MIKAILFDFDRTIMDRDTALNNYIHDQYERLFQLEYIQKKKFIERFIELDAMGYVWKDIVYSTLIKEWDLPHSMEELVKDYEDNFQKFAVGFPNIDLVLKKLKEQGYLLGLVTNGRVGHQRNNVIKLGIDSLFDCIVVSDEVGMKKPNANIFHFALDLINVHPNEAMYVGDHLVNDVQASKEVGMISVWLKSSDFKEDSIADYTIDQFDEILDVVKSIEHN